MDRLIDIWRALEAWYMAHGEEPLFNLVQGVLLGLVIAAGVALVIKGLKREAEDEAD